MTLKHLQKEMICVSIAQDSISLVEKSTKQVCELKMQEFPVTSLENKPRAAWAARSQGVGRALSPVTAAQSWMLIKAPAKSCRHVDWLEEQGETCGWTGVLCSLL